MGIVIINGKRYDSVTGLMITDNSTTADQKIQSSFDAQTPDWIASYVDEVKHEAAVSRTQQPTNVASDVNKDDGQVKQNSATIMPVRTAGQTARRTVSASHTLNRRFVKKPLTEGGKYAESPVEHRIKLARQARQAAAPINIPEDAQLNAANKANEDFVPMLTKRQAESVSKLSNNEPLNVRVARAEAERANRTQPVSQTANNHDVAVKVKPAIRLTPTQRTATSDDDILNERLSQLSQILQNAKELDEQERSRKTAKQPSLSDQLAKSADSSNSNAKEAKRSRRKFRLPTIFATAGAMAVVAGLGIYVAMPTISVKMAASKAGITTNTPYIPSGFTIDGEVASADGHMTINYRSKNGGDGYSVSIKENSTDTQGSLRRRIAELYSNGYRTEQSGDKTLLRYDGKVTWLDNGIEYTINTNNYLDSDEITSIVDSL